MVDNYMQEVKAPFNMAIATLMSLRQTLDKIREIESRIEFPAEERQRIKIELVKRFYVDSSPLIFEKKVLDIYKKILDMKPIEVTIIDKNNPQKRWKSIRYSFELNKELDECLLELQLELQKKKFFMPPTDDMGMSVGRMN